MKVLLIVSIVISLAFAQIPNPNDGRYYPSDDGQYRPDNSGQYNGEDGSYRPDNSGAYHPDGSGAYRGTADKYVHQADRFGGSGGGGGGGGGSGGSGGAFGVGGRGRPGGTTIVTVQPVRTGVAVVTGSRVGSGVSGAVITGSRVGLGGTGSRVSSGLGTIVTGVRGSTGGSYGGSYDRGSTGSSGSYGGSYDNRNYAIIRKEAQVGEDGYHYVYETENKILGEEQGRLANVGTDNEAMQATGYFEYTGPDNVVYRVDYTANENGFVPSAAHLPTPPPVPEAILRSLEYQRSIGEL